GVQFGDEAACSLVRERSGSGKVGGGGLSNRVSVPVFIEREAAGHIFPFAAEVGAVHQRRSRQVEFEHESVGGSFQSALVCSWGRWEISGFRTACHEYTGCAH